MKEKGAGSLPVNHPKLYLSVAQFGQSACLGSRGPEGNSQVQILPDRPIYATLAQLVEHEPEEFGVLGSIPRGGTK